jgi:two-component system sensor histidine kinase UhpB
VQALRLAHDDLVRRVQAEEVRKRLLAQILSAQEEERRRIARDLHDGIGQSLTALLIGLRTVEEAPTSEAARSRAAELRQIIVAAVEEVRRLARGLRPSILDDLGLAAALQHYVADCSQTYGIAVEVEAADLAARRLPPAVETTLYRIVQEAVTNTAKHAAAKKVCIVARRQCGGVHLSVQDDGCGFDMEGLRRRSDVRDHLGLCDMRERAALLNGSLMIESRPGSGTTVSISIPLAEANHGKDSGADRG